MAVPFSNTKLRVPHGFQALLEGMAKEILQAQPSDIYSFSAMYFENLLQMRSGEKTDADPATKQKEIDDRIYNNNAFQQSEMESGETEQEAAVTIQSKYRQHQAKSTADDLREQNAAVKIQAAARGYATRQQLKQNRNTEKACSRQSFVVEDEDKELDDLADEEALMMTGRSGEPDEELQNLDSQRECDDQQPTQQKVSSALSAEGLFEGLGDEQQADEPTEIFDDNKTEDHEVAKEDGSSCEHHKSATPVIGEVKDEKEQAEEHQDVQAFEDESATPVQDEVTEMEEQQDILAVEEEEEQQETQAVEEEEEQQVVQAVDDDQEQVDEDSKEDDSSWEIHKAATAIQAGFRGMKARQEIRGVSKAQNNEVSVAVEDDVVRSMAASVADDEVSDELKAEEEKMKHEVEQELDQVVADADEQQDMERLESRQKLESDVKDKSGEDVVEADDAASKIQAGYRGMKARREIHLMKKAKVEADESPVEVPDEESKQNADDTKLDANESTVEVVEDENKQNPEDTLRTSEREISEMFPEADAAASAIQAGFRGMKTRKEIRELKKRGEMDSEVAVIAPVEQNFVDADNEAGNQAASKIQAGFRGMKTRKEIKVLRESKLSKTEDDLQVGVVDDQEAVSQAIVVIQAGFRGMKARQEVQKLKESKMEVLNVDHKEENVDESEQFQAATKIQAGFRGMKARQEVKALKNSETLEEIDPAATIEVKEQAVDEIEEAAEMERAVSKIQAGFRGMKARKEVHAIKDSRAADSVTEEQEIEARWEDSLTKTKTDELVADGVDDAAAKEEAMSSPTQEDAALKIQAGLLAYKVRLAQADAEDDAGRQETDPLATEDARRSAEPEMMEEDHQPSGNASARQSVNEDDDVVD